MPSWKAALLLRQPDGCSRRSIVDVRALRQRGLIKKGRLREMFAVIEPALIRYPAVDPATFRDAVTESCDGEE